MPSEISEVLRFAALPALHMPDPSSPSLKQLNDRRRRAVELRLAGMTLPQIRAETGLSAPTVIGAYRAFLSKGWAGVATPARGRRQGAGRQLESPQEARWHQCLQDSPPEIAGLDARMWTPAAAAEAAQRLFGIALRGRTLARSLQRAGFDFVPMADLARRQAEVDAWRADQLRSAMRRARLDHATLVWCGQASLPPGPGAAGPRRLLVAQTLRGSLAWLPLAQPYQIDSYLDFLDRLRRTWPGPLHLLLHGIDARAQPRLQRWLDDHPDCRLIPCPAAPARARGRAAGGPPPPGGGPPPPPPPPPPPRPPPPRPPPPPPPFPWA
jgi:sulfate adenylyltransferase subunit 2